MVFSSNNEDDEADVILWVRRVDTENVEIAANTANKSPFKELGERPAAKLFLQKTIMGELPITKKLVIRVLRLARLAGLN